jgi:DtxR family transcriptional regulator, Mn-dependent transcriptional regulator
MPTSTVEDYVKQILLEEQRQSEALVPMGKIATALNVNPSTVTAMVKALADSGLVTYEPYSGVRLTPPGRKLAAHVLRRHRLLELFLVQVVGLDWSEVHPEAEQLEHAVSERVIDRIDEILGHPSVDPHGDPIPSAAGVVREPDFPSLLLCPLGRRARVERVSDQSAEFLRLVERSGLVPGSLLSVEARDETADTVRLRLESGGEVNLGWRAADKILVQPLGG